MDEKESKYLYPVEELDKMLDQMDEGVELFLNDQLMVELEMRKREREIEMFGTAIEDEESDYIKQKHQEMLREKMKQKARKAHREDVMYIELTEEQKQKIYADVETSFVRRDPNTPYNMTQEEIYSSAEEKLILEKLSKLRVAYYNQIDFQNAMNTILTAIDYSLEHDYPWMTKEEAIAAFNAGQIKFSFCQIPKLFLDFKTQVKDPNILQGVVSGNVELVDKSKKNFVIRDYSNSELVSVPYGVMSTAEEDYYVDAHKKGQFTPISAVIQSNNTIYNRYTPQTYNKKKNEYVGLLDKFENPVSFDWTQENAHARYDLFRKGKSYDIEMLMEDVNKNNNGINKQVAINMQSYLMALNSVTLTHDEKANQIQDGYKKQNEEVIKMEQSILQKIRVNNMI